MAIHTAAILSLDDVYQTKQTSTKQQYQKLFRTVKQYQIAKQVIKQVANSLVKNPLQVSFVIDKPKSPIIKPLTIKLVDKSLFCKQVYTLLASYDSKTDGLSNFAPDGCEFFTLATVSNKLLLRKLISDYLNEFGLTDAKHFAKKLGLNLN